MLVGDQPTNQLQLPTTNYKALYPIIQVFVNPFGGKGRGKQLWEEQVIWHQLFSVEIHKTNVYYMKYDIYMKYII